MMLWRGERKNQTFSIGGRGKPRWSKSWSNPSRPVSTSGPSDYLPFHSKMISIPRIRQTKGVSFKYGIFPSDETKKKKKNECPDELKTFHSKMVSIPRIRRKKRVLGPELKPFYSNMVSIPRMRQIKRRGGERESVCPDGSWSRFIQRWYISFEWDGGWGGEPSARTGGKGVSFKDGVSPSD